MSETTTPTSVPLMSLASALAVVEAGAAVVAGLGASPTASEALRVVVEAARVTVAAEARLREVDSARIRIKHLLEDSEAEGASLRARLRAAEQRAEAADAEKAEADGAHRAVLARLREVESGRATAEALVISHEAHIEKLEARLREAELLLTRAERSNLGQVMVAEAQPNVAEARAAAQARTDCAIRALLASPAPERCNYCGDAHDVKDCAKCNDLIARHAAPDPNSRALLASPAPEHQAAACAAGTCPLCYPEQASVLAAPEVKP